MDRTFVVASPGYNVEVDVQPIIKKALDSALKFPTEERGCFKQDRELELMSLEQFR